MFKIKSHHTPRISNGLAVFAALLLLVSALMGYSDSVITAKETTDQAAEFEAVPTQTFARQSPGNTAHKKSNSFKASLFLFRID